MSLSTVVLGPPSIPPPPLVVGEPTGGNWWADYSDDDLVARAHDGDLDALDQLLVRYRRLPRMKARGYFLAGGDVDDVEQEGMIGLFKAVRDYRPERGSSFRAFAELCVTRQIISAIKSATRRKHRPLNHYVSLWGFRVVDDPGAGSGGGMDDVVEPSVPDPADQIVSLESLAGLQAELSRLLTGLEVEVLCLYLEGRSYQEISQRIDRHVKCVDNALQRVKRKLEPQFGGRGSAIPRSIPPEMVAAEAIEAVA